MDYSRSAPRIGALSDGHEQLIHTLNSLSSRTDTVERTIDLHKRRRMRLQQKELAATSKVASPVFGLYDKHIDPLSASLPAFRAPNQRELVGKKLSKPRPRMKVQQWVSPSAVSHGDASFQLKKADPYGDGEIDAFLQHFKQKVSYCHAPPSRLEITAHDGCQKRKPLFAIRIQAWYRGVRLRVRYLRWRNRRNAFLGKHLKALAMYVNARKVRVCTAFPAFLNT